MTLESPDAPIAAASRSAVAAPSSLAATITTATACIKSTLTSSSNLNLASNSARTPNQTDASSTNDTVPSSPGTSPSPPRSISPASTPSPSSVTRQARPNGSDSHPAQTGGPIDAMAALARQRPSTSLSMNIPAVASSHQHSCSRSQLVAPTSSSIPASGSTPPVVSAAGRLSTTQLFATLLQRSGSVSPMEGMPSAAQGVKRKLTEELGASFDVTSPSDVVLPKDPARRASIIHLATAAAAAVLQGQIADRRFSQQEHINKRQRTREQQLTLLAEQAGMAHHARGRAHDESTGGSKATEGTSSSQRFPATTIASATLSALSPTADVYGQEARNHHVVEMMDRTIRTANPLRSFSIPSDVPPTPAAPTGLMRVSLDPNHQREWEDTVSSDAFLDEAKMVANHYGKFYRFEQEWAKRALALGATQALKREECIASHRDGDDARSDPIARGPSPSSKDQPSTTPFRAADTLRFEDEHSVSQQSSQSERRISPRGSPRHRSPVGTPSWSRAVSPLEMALEHRPSTQAYSQTTTRTGASSGAPSKGLFSVILNFADLVKARQEACSGLEALADRAKELPGTTDSGLASQNARYSVTTDGTLLPGSSDMEVSMVKADGAERPIKCEDQDHDWNVVGEADPGSPRRRSSERMSIASMM